MCDVPRCRTRDSDALIFYGHMVCDSHWQKHCDREIDLKQIFKIEEAKQ